MPPTEIGPSELTPSPSVEGSGLDIPEARDGFFGYPEEKTLQHVRFELRDGEIVIIFTVSSRGMPM